MKRVIITSREEAAVLYPSKEWGPTAMIRITAYSDFPELVFLDAYVATMELRFGDITDDKWQYLQKYEPKLIEEAIKDGWHPTPISEQQAKDILDFVEALQGKIETIVVHCDAGISRSSAVALSLCEKYGLHEEQRKIEQSPFYRPNQTVRSRLREFYYPTAERQRLYDKLFNK